MWCIFVVIASFESVNSFYLPSSARLVVSEFRDGSDRFFRLSGDRQRVHDKTQIGRHAQHEGKRVKSESVRVLKQNQPLDAHLLPLFRHSVLVQKLVNVAVAVRLGLDPSIVATRIKDHTSIVVIQCGHSLPLLHDRDLTLLHAKVFVLFEQLDRFLVRVA